MQTSRDLQQYRAFRSFLLKNGFIMLQESVYARMLLNSSSMNLLKVQIEKNLPKTGLIQMLKVTERQFNDIEYLRGQSKTNVVTNTQRIIEL